MKARFPVLALTIATLLGISIIAPAPAFAAAGDQCDHACLDSIVEKYIAALASHDPKKAPLARGVRYTEVSDADRRDQPVCNVDAIGELTERVLHAPLSGTRRAMPWRGALWNCTAAQWRREARWR